ncbi:conserved hypothetical protein [[Clostridium] ultunense Esp]|nr:conserved hypothetical protein [[Clostridium] ultunense Esp]
MDTYEIQVTQRIKADTELIYRVLSDYQNEHPRILPKPYFASTEIEQGGIGAGTIVRVQMKVMGVVNHLRLFVTEPIPGREIHEEDPAIGIKTIFTLEPDPDHSSCQVSIRTIWQKKKGFRGLIEQWLVPLIVRSIYAKELEILKSYCEEKQHK